MAKISVIGSGTMGNGIAHLFAMKGHQVTLVDLNQEALDRAMKTITKNLDRMVKKERISEADKTQTLANITTATNMVDSAVPESDLVVEAATENLEVKLGLFQALDNLCQEDTILASNTSSISITTIAAATNRPEKVIGMHFFNPVPVMKLVEVVKGYATDEAVAQKVVDLSKELGKVPVLVNDYPGFVSNRILMPMINEAIHTLFEGVAGVEEIDTVMKLGMAHPMGPLFLADFIGLDVCLAIMRVLQQGFGNPKYAPCPLLVNMVAAGKLGRKSGEGFYQYQAGSKEVKVANRFVV